MWNQGLIIASRRTKFTIGGFLTIGGHRRRASLTYLNWLGLTTGSTVGRMAGHPEVGLRRRSGTLTSGEPPSDA